MENLAAWRNVSLALGGMLIGRGIKEFEDRNPDFGGKSTPKPWLNTIFGLLLIFGAILFLKDSK